jgi:uncharacterized protein (TIGR02217 family)
MFLNVSLPEEISYSAVGGPEFLTNVAILQNGFEHRNINWEAPRYSYSIGYDVLNLESAKKLLAFFNIVRGRAHSFRFKDWLDFEAKDQKLIRIENDKYQLSKLYKLNDQYFYNRRITKPKNVEIKNGDIKLIENDDYTIDYHSGIVNIDEKKFDMSKVTADFEFDVCVRFESDILELSNDSFRLYSWKSIKLIETRD